MLFPTVENIKMRACAYQKSMQKQGTIMAISITIIMSMLNAMQKSAKRTQPIARAWLDKKHIKDNGVT